MKSDRTKELLAHSLEELARIKPLAQITVQDITDNCGLSRRAFYYHFQERQDLIDWVYARDRERSVRTTSPETIKDNLMRLAACFSENPELYAYMISSSGETTPPDYFFKATYACWIRLFESYLAQQGEEVPEGDLNMLAMFFIHGTIGVAREAKKADLGDFGTLFERYFSFLVSLLDHGLYETLDSMSTKAQG